MAYYVSNRKGSNVLGETFKSKSAAKQALVDMISGAPNKRAMRYVDYRIRKR